MKMEIPAEETAGDQLHRDNDPTVCPESGGQWPSALALSLLVCLSQKEPGSPESIYTLLPAIYHMPALFFFFLLISESTFFTLGNENAMSFVSSGRANSGEANSFRMPGVSDRPLSEKGRSPGCPVSPQEERGGLRTTDRSETLARHSPSQSDS